MNQESEALRSLQDDIYRDKVMRARQLTVAQRLADVIECSQAGLHLMFSGVRMNQPTLSEKDTWEEVGARIHRVRRMRDHRFYRQTESAS